MVVGVGVCGCVGCRIGAGIGVLGCSACGGAISGVGMVVGGGGDPGVRPPALGGWLGFESDVKLGGAYGDGIGADGVGPGGGIPEEEPGWGGAFDPPLDEVVFADVVQHLCSFQVEEELDVFRDFGGAPVLVHVE